MGGGDDGGGRVGGGDGDTNCRSVVIALMPRRPGRLLTVYKLSYTCSAFSGWRTIAVPSTDLPADDPSVLSSSRHVGG